MKLEKYKLQAALSAFASAFLIQNAGADLRAIEPGDSSSDADSLSLSQQLRDEILSLPTEMHNVALTLPTNTPFTVHLEWGAPTAPLPSVLAIPENGDRGVLREYSDMVHLTANSYMDIAGHKIRLHCVVTQARDVSTDSTPQSRFLWIYLASNGDGSENCMGPVKKLPGYDNDTWSSYVKFIIVGPKMQTPGKATLKYGGVEYDINTNW